MPTNPNPEGATPVAKGSGLPTRIELYSQSNTRVAVDILNRMRAECRDIDLNHKETQKALNVIFEELEKRNTHTDSQRTITDALGAALEALISEACRQENEGGGVLTLDFGDSKLVTARAALEAWRSGQ